MDKLTMVQALITDYFGIDGAQARTFAIDIRNMDTQSRAANPSGHVTVLAITGYLAQHLGLQGARVLEISKEVAADIRNVMLA